MLSYNLLNITFDPELVIVFIFAFADDFCSKLGELELA
jgi:hypothetical protein